MQDVVDHTGQAFLGVTLGCARCHDHMYDPVLQKDYYQVRAIFEPHQVRIDRVPGTLETRPRMVFLALTTARSTPRRFFSSVGTTATRQAIRWRQEFLTLWAARSTSSR